MEALKKIISEERKVLDRLFIVAIIGGAVVGFFLLYPINEFVYYYEHGIESPSVWTYISNQVINSLKGHTPIKTAFYAGVGAVFGVLVALIFNAWRKKMEHIQKLHSALEENLGALIAQGEGPKLEFKSSFRWDYKQDKFNRGLEDAVLKTLAGFMNGQGGTLLIGVDDSGEVLGLEKDYETLKKKNRDGFELAIMTAVSMKLGPEFCQNLHVMFHAIDGKDVCRILVAPSHQPVFVKQDKATKFYLRTGGSTRELNIEEAMSYVANRR